MLTVGVDEVGRGSLAGPVLAAAVILHAEVNGLADSKVLAPAVRERLSALLWARARVGIGLASVREIDAFGIVTATALAMRRAVVQVGAYDRLLVDGRPLAALHLAHEAIVRGDASVPEIQAASIVAKVSRDRLMSHLSACLPAYHFAANKGYASYEHGQALLEYGISVMHRQQFCTTYLNNKKGTQPLLG